MIIGKSLTALGGGGLKPEIHVTAKAGALLNLHYRDSSIILQSYQLGAEETQHTFVVSVSETAYVVEDVTNSASVEVLVDVVAQYSVDITHILWLYKDGDECEDVTGGYLSGADVQTVISTYGITTKESDGLVVAQNTSITYQVAGFRTANKISFSDYITLNVEIDADLKKNSTYTAGFFVRFNESAPISTNNLRSGSILVQDSGDAYDVFKESGNYSGVISAPLPPVALSCNSPAYLCLWTGHFWGGTPPGGTVKVKKIWLEK